MLNGTTGKPIRDKRFSVWLGDGGMLLLDTDRNGEVGLDITNVHPREIRVSPNSRIDCRFNYDFAVGSRIKYSLDEITSRGIVSENLCGKTTTVSADPGVLILFVRPKTFIEWFMI